MPKCESFADFMLNFALSGKQSCLNVVLSPGLIDVQHHNRYNKWNKKKKKFKMSHSIVDENKFLNNFHHFQASL